MLGGVGIVWLWFWGRAGALRGGRVGAFRWLGRGVLLTWLFKGGVGVFRRWWEGRGDEAVGAIESGGTGTRRGRGRRG